MRKIAAAAAIIAALAIVAFAATNTVPATRAGNGAGNISGYTVSNVTYNLDSTNPENLASVEFDLDAAAKTVKVRLQSTGGNWYNCTDADGNGPGNHWSCNTTGQQVQPMDELRVVATQ
ncbi:MAG: hypothetical protein RMK67_02810 [Chloroflexota bacterium]|jgi:hypothetical protein|nr:hypothetical protein [Chloroflexota bacterium]